MLLQLTLTWKWKCTSFNFFTQFLSDFFSGPKKYRLFRVIFLKSTSLPGIYVSWWICSYSRDACLNLKLDTKLTKEHIILWASFTWNFFFFHNLKLLGANNSIFIIQFEVKVFFCVNQLVSWKKCLQLKKQLFTLETWAQVCLSNQISHSLRWKLFLSF